MSITWTDFGNFFKKQFKHGSLVLAVFIPLLLMLSRFKFVRKDFMVMLNQILIVIALIEVLFKLGLHFYLQAKIEIAEVNKDLSEGKPEVAKGRIKNNITQSVDRAKETAKGIIDYVKGPEELEPEPQQEIPGHEISVR